MKTAAAMGPRGREESSVYSEPSADGAFPLVILITLWVMCYDPLCTDAVTEGQESEANFQVGQLGRGRGWWLVEGEGPGLEFQVV